MDGRSQRRLPLDKVDWRAESFWRAHETDPMSTI
jgi:hypothetical protein